MNPIPIKTLDELPSQNRIFIPGRKRTAEELRQENISFYQTQIRAQICRGAPEINLKSAAYNLLAYESMTDKEILMSDERDQEYKHNENWETIQKLRKYQEDSRRIIIHAK